MHCNQEIQLSWKEFHKKQWTQSDFCVGGKTGEGVGNNSHKKVLTIVNPNRYLKVVILQLKMFVTFFICLVFPFLPELFILDHLGVCDFKEKICFNFSSSPQIPVIYSTSFYHSPKQNKINDIQCLCSVIHTCLQSWHAFKDCFIAKVLFVPCWS